MKLCPECQLSNVPIAWHRKCDDKIKQVKKTHASGAIAYKNILHSTVTHTGTLALRQVSKLTNIYKIIQLEINMLNKEKGII